LLILSRGQPSLPGLGIKEAQVSDTNKKGTIFIREHTPLPENLSIESEAFLSGWRVVRNLDRSTLARDIETRNWFFFYLAGEIRATVLGRDRPGTLRRAVRCVLAKQEGQKFNSLEITKIVSKRFLGIPFMNITAHSRHIQQDIALVPAKDFVLRMPIAPNGEVVARQYPVLISST
jgi:hypothetical protein